MQFVGRLWEVIRKGKRWIVITDAVAVACVPIAAIAVAVMRIIAISA